MNFIPKKNMEEAARMMAPDWGSRKDEERREVFELLDSCTRAAAKSPERLEKYIDVQARFDSMSVSNALLVSEQCPEAVQLGTYEEWKRAGTAVRAGEKAILTLSSREYTRRDGTRGRKAEIRKVFDISQTDAPAPEAAGRKLDPASFAREVVSASPCPVLVRDGENGSMAEYDSNTGTVFLSGGAASTKEEAFATALGVMEGACMRSGYHMETAKEAADIAACMLCRRFGIEFEAPQVSDLGDYYKPKEIRGVFSRARDAFRSAARVIEDSLDLTVESPVKEAGRETA
ncbi:MAG: hypothetical protein ACOX6J_05640 [Oscillospiraceae bacterium]|jgi:hypothetical protein